jgi:hypothetical protein
MAQTKQYCADMIRPSSMHDADRTGNSAISSQREFVMRVAVDNIHEGNDLISDADFPS